MAPEPEVDDSERFEGPVTLDDILAAFELVDETVYTSSDIAEVVGCSRESARQKLTRLYDQGRINRRKHGRFIVWWRTPPEDVEAERLLARLSQNVEAERLLARLSQMLGVVIVVEDTVYEDGQTRHLAGAQTEYVEQLSKERDEPIVVGEIVYEDGDIDLRAGVQSETVASEIEEMMRGPAAEKVPLFRAALKRLAAADRLDERAVLDVINADDPSSSLDMEGGVDAETLVERIPEENYETILREHFDTLADKEELTMEALLGALDEADHDE